MRRDQPRTYTAETEAPKPYTQLGYTPPNPQQRAPAYEPYNQQPSPYSRPYAYGTQAAGYGTQPPASPYVSAPYGTQQAYAGQMPRSQPYGQPPYAQQQPYPQQPQQPSGLTTASVGGQPPLAPPMRPPMNQMPPAQPPATYAPLTTGSLPRHTTVPLSNQGTYVVREGDTLYGISKRTGVPVQDLITANKIQNTKISIGQKITVPQKHAAK